MKQDTKDKILQAGARIIHHKGYNHTGIQEVLQAAGVPKGSFYFYFKNKEDFGLQVVDFFNAMYLDMLAPIFQDNTLAPLERLEKVLDYFIALFTERDYRCGCPIGNLSQEMGDLSQAFSTKLASSVTGMAQIYQEMLDEAKAAGQISQDMETREVAEFIVSSWHGSLIKMKITRSTDPLEIHKQFTLKLLTL